MHKSKFVQFLLFHLAARDFRFAQVFPKLLLTIFFDERNTFLKRQSAVVYLGSYLARATFLPFHFVNVIAQELLRWCYAYVTTSSGALGVTVLPQFRTEEATAVRAAAASAESVYASIDGGVEYDEFGRLVPKDNTGAAVMEKHSTFLCCVQTLCYVLCFHGSALAQTHRESASRLHWECILTCSLLPLRHCAPSIRTEVTRILRHDALLSPELWEHIPLENSARPPSHNRQDLTAFYRVGSSGRGQGQGAYNLLESFFPFDPCLLAGMSQSVEAHYREWRGIPGIDVAQLDDQGDETNEEDDDDLVSESLASSMVSMSVSSVDPGQTRSSSFAKSSGSDASYWGSTMHESVAPEGDNPPRRNVHRPRQYSVTSTGSW